MSNEPNKLFKVKMVDSNHVSVHKLLYVVSDSLSKIENFHKFNGNPSYTIKSIEYVDICYCVSGSDDENTNTETN